MGGGGWEGRDGRSRAVECGGRGRGGVLRRRDEVWEQADCCRADRCCMSTEARLCFVTLQRHNRWDLFSHACVSHIFFDKDCLVLHAWAKGL